jgi:hypothetical protein
MLNNIIGFTIKKVKYSFFLKSFISKIFLLSYEKIVGDTYSKLWKFNGRVLHFLRLENPIVHIDDDEQLNSNIVLGYRYTRVHSYIDIFLFKNAEVNSYTGLINIDREFYFTDLFVSSLPAQTHIPMFRKIIKGRVFVSAEKNYYHFITEELYPILKLVENNISFIVLNPGNIKWKNDILSFLFPCLQIIEVEKFQYIFADEVLGVTKDKSGYIHPKVIHTLRSTFRKYISKHTDFKYIYISRRLAPSRRIKNEELFEKKLAGLGFKILFTEDYNFQDKVQIFSDCKIVVSLHGAGLTNIITLDKNSIIVELVDKFHFSHCYKALANVIGLRYYSQLLSFDDLNNSIIDTDRAFEFIKNKILNN